MLLAKITLQTAVSKSLHLVTAKKSWWLLSWAPSAARAACADTG